MRTFGIVTASLAGVVAVVGVALGIRSVPDLRRYLRIRWM